MNMRVSGRPDMGWHVYCLSFLNAPLLGASRMLVLGRDSTWLEQDLLRRNVFARCDVIGLPETALESATTTGSDRRMRYTTADLTTIRLPRSMYDAVWCDSTLCRIADLEHVTRQIARSLKPDGVLFAHEYVGAARDAIGRVQREAIEAAFSLIPLRYRYPPLSDARPLETVELPGSEGFPEKEPGTVSSASILAVLRRHFDVVRCRAVGGSLLRFLLRGIAGNFRTEDSLSMAVLDTLFGIEDVLIDSGQLGSDFALIVATPKPTSTARSSR